MPTQVVFDGLAVTVYRPDGSIAGSWAAIFLSRPLSLQ